MHGDAVPVAVRELRSIEELAEIDGLFAAIWGSQGNQVAMPVNLLRALEHSGNYVAGAYIAGRLVGAGIGWMGARDGRRELHSHVVGVARPLQGKGVGLAIKLHQRDWARSRDIGRIVWTFDPLTRRNGWFNLSKLRARAVEYHPNFYGTMPDELNGSDETDRCLVCWDVASGADLGPTPASWSVDGPPEGYSCLLTSRPGAPHQPLMDPCGQLGEPVCCQVPTDIVGLRRQDEKLAVRWREALRATMGVAMAAGYVTCGMTRDGYYLLRPPLDGGTL